MTLVLPDAGALRADPCAACDDEDVLVAGWNTPDGPVAVTVCPTCDALASIVDHEGRRIAP